MFVSLGGLEYADCLIACKMYCNTYLCIALSCHFTSLCKPNLWQCVILSTKMMCLVAFIRPPTSMPTAQLLQGGQLGDSGGSLCRKLKFHGNIIYIYICYICRCINNPNKVHDIITFLAETPWLY